MPLRDPFTVPRTGFVQLAVRGVGNVLPRAGVEQVRPVPPALVFAMAALLLGIDRGFALCTTFAGPILAMCISSRESFACPLERDLEIGSKVL